MKKISVIIPCYNVSRWIDRCLTSIIRQTMGMEALEVICIDDASEDNTWERLQDWEQKFPENIILIQQEVNRRQGTARNLGLQYASADWIAFVDADDWLEFDYFQRLYEPGIQYECEVVACGSVRDFSDASDEIGVDHRIFGKEYPLTVDSMEAREMLLGYKPLGIGPAAKIIKKDFLFENMIFFPDDLTFEDHYWIPLLHFYATKMYILEDRLYHYFWNPYSTSLAENNDYYMDCLTVQLIKWKDYHERGLMENYREVLERDFLWYAIICVETAILRCNKPSFSFFKMEAELIKQYVPDMERYVSAFPPKNQILLRILYASSVSKDEFEQIVKMIKSD